MIQKVKKNILTHFAWYGVAILLMIGGIVLGCLLPEEEEVGVEALKVEDVFFVKTRQDGLMTDMNITIFITNDGDVDVNSLKVRAFAVEENSNLARDEDLTDLGNIEKQTTSEGKLQIRIPNNLSYRIELLIFKNDEISIRGSGGVNLVGVGSAQDYKTEDGGVMGDDNSGERALTTDGDEEDEGVLADGMSLCGLSMAFLVVVIFILVGILIWVLNRDKRKTGFEKEREEVARQKMFSLANDIPPSYVEDTMKTDIVAVEKELPPSK